MLARKTKGLFVERAENYVLAARTGGLQAPIVVEELKEFPASVTDSEIRAFAQGRGGSLVHARVGIYPPKRFLHRASLDPKRIKEPRYLNEILETQARVSPAACTTNILNCTDGQPFDAARVFQKEVLFCGAPTEEIHAAQDSLLALGIYPERLEIGTVAMLGGLLHYVQFRKVTGATLVLELAREQTHLHVLAGGTVDITRTVGSGFNSVLPVVQKELGLKDEESAAKLFFSNNFDFTTMGQQLLRKLIKDLQSAIGLYEVQTGQSVGQLYIPLLPPNLGWMVRTFAESLGVTALQLDFNGWLESAGISFASGEPAGRLDPRWLGLLSLMIDFTPSMAAADGKK